MKFKKKIAGVLSTVMIISSLSISSIVEATDSTDPSYFTYNGSTITGYTGSDADIVLPTEFDGSTITGVGGSVFL